MLLHIGISVLSACGWVEHVILDEIRGSITLLCMLAETGMRWMKRDEER